MKSEITTAVITTIAGIVIAFLVTNLALNSLMTIEEKKVTVLESTVSTDLAEPDPEIFNPKALNPTVEVYVGNDCVNVSENGECLDQATQESD